MTLTQILQANAQSYRPKRTPMHFGRYMWKGNAPELWGDYKLYNTRHLPVLVPGECVQDKIDKIEKGLWQWQS